jgi:tetratricopeptide (TPR) repeat protein
MSVALYRHLLRPLDPDEGLPDPEERSLSFIGIQRGQKMTVPADDSKRISIAVYPCQRGGAVMNGLLLAVGHALASSHQAELLPIPLHEDSTGELVEGDFTPADWGLDIEEDFALFGEYVSRDGLHQLTLHLETSTDEAYAWKASGADERALWGEMVSLLDTLADHLDIEFDIRPFDAATTASAGALRQVFEALYRFHADWMRHPKQSETEGDDSALQAPFEPIGWLRSSVWAFHVLLNLRLKPDGLIERWLSASLSEQYGVFALVTSWSFPELTASLTEKTEAVIEAGGASEDNHVAVARLYEYLGRPDLAAEVCQAAMGSGQASTQVWLAYADALGLSSDAGLRVEGFIWEEEALAEYSAALRRAVEQRPIPTRLAELCGDAAGQDDYVTAAQYLTRLCEADARFVRVEGLLDELSHLDDLSWFVAPIQRVVSARSEFFRAKLVLAKALRLAGEPERARSAVGQARQSAQTLKEQAEAQTLALILDNPSYEGEFADVVRRLQSAEADLFERDLEFLEFVVETAPQHPEGYLALSAAYGRMDEPEAALEVLLDAEQKAYLVPEVYLSLSELLATSDEWDLALENVRKGLDLAPNHVPLMAQAAFLSHRLGDADGAVAFLRRAHHIRPYHPRVMAVAKLIDRENQDDGQLG